MEEIKKTTKTIKIIVKDVYNKEGVLQSFKEYQYVNQEKKGLLQRAKFKRDVILAKFDGLKKFTVEVDYCKEDNRFEFPVVWISGVHYDTIKKIY